MRAKASLIIDSHLHCPVCGHDYMHIEKVEKGPYFKDENEIGTVKITFSCEECQTENKPDTWVLGLQQWKGQMRVEVTEL
jgi:C4-type Zn-finger protein